MIVDYISPKKVYQKLQTCLSELRYYRNFKKIVLDLTNSGKLEEIGLKSDINANMYIGIDLNPELLLYSETSQESVELRLISEKMAKYNDFLTKEGLLDSIKVDYDRVKNDQFYGYILQISYNFKQYNRFDLIYSISYFSIIALTLFGLSFVLL
jgi:hypothetical protein